MVICCQWSRILLSALLGQKSAFAFEPLVEREKKNNNKANNLRKYFHGTSKNTPNLHFTLNRSCYAAWPQAHIMCSPACPDPQPSVGNPQPTTSVWLHAAAAPMEKCNAHVHSDPHCYPKHAELWDSLTSTWVTSNAHHREKSSCT